MTILVTGGAGFIGSNFILDWLANPEAESIVNLDKLTYAGNLANLQHVENDPRHIFVKGDIGDRDLVATLLKKHKIRAVLNFAAETIFMALVICCVDVTEVILSFTSFKLGITVCRVRY